jgi:predicted PP-loop superfamily ATPase
MLLKSAYNASKSLNYSVFCASLILGSVDETFIEEMFLRIENGIFSFKFDECGRSTDRRLRYLHWVLASRL